ncbi:Histone-lysine N-methyltransferase ASHR1 [Rhizoctonia solani]|uniref:Histone-lysine N-methyltransferase ASHR1 n=1 Tax=Rhizoctonia solani TaxID=456999 RepID=A0A0K6GEC9_9AGAM|nr:Histone-lysine N-methyltransferase ASHR1 [Rhizoctonia solani]
MVSSIPQNGVFELISDPRARSRAVASRALKTGSVIITEVPLAVAIHPSYKGRRCDNCLRELDGLQKCSGCGVYWYCGVACQSASWKRHHKRLCAFSKTYASSSAYKDATEETQTDICLLAHLAAEHFYKCNTLSEAQSNPAVQTFWDLQSAQPDAGQNLISPLSFTSSSVLSAAASRFGNNNFVIHDARLVPYAHGVFATASRSFNHSCRPNAVAMFEETSSGVRMLIKLVEDVATGEEISISYTDPASPDSKRRDALQHAYGFFCQCPRCITGASAAPPSPADEPIIRNQIETIVQEQVRNNESGLEIVRDVLAPVSLERGLLDWLPNWTADFSKSSHEGPYDQALQHGNVVLGVYALVYPSAHPLLGKCLNFTVM